MKIMP